MMHIPDTEARGDAYTIIYIINCIYIYTYICINIYAVDYYMPVVLQ